MIPAKAVGASSNHQTVCTGSAALFEHGLKLGHGSVAWQAAAFAQRAGSAGLALAAVLLSPVGLIASVPLFLVTNANRCGAVVRHRCACA